MEGGRNMKEVRNVVLLILVLFGVIRLLNTVWHLKNENGRLSDNQRALLSDINHYRTRDSLSVASVERLTLSVGELKQYNGELLQTIEDLNIKARRVQSISRTAAETEYRVETVFKDSVIVSYKDSVTLDTLRCVNYSDSWLRFTACERNGTLDTFIESRDTLISIVHRVPKRFLFFRFGTKAVRQEIMSKNPHSKISYTEYIEVKN